VSSTLVNLFSLVYMFLYLPGTIFSAWVFDRFGLRTGLLVGAFGNLLCGAIRLAAMWMLPGNSLGAWGLSLFGQCVGGMVQPFFTNAPSKISGVWFPHNERDITTAIAAMSNPLGNAVGMFIPTLIVSTADISQFTILLGGQAGVCLAVAATAVLVISDGPPTPPSLSSESRSTMRAKSLRRVTSGKGGMWDLPDASHVAVNSAPLHAGVGDEDEEGGPEGDTEGGLTSLQRLVVESRALLSDRQFLFLLLAFSVGLGVFNAVVTLIAQIVQPCGYGSDEAGIFGGVLVLSGLVGAGIVGVVIEATKAYTMALRVGFVVCSVCVIALLGLLQENMFGPLVAMFAVSGLTMLPILPITLEAATEHSYPIPEESAASVLLLGGQLFGIVYVFALPALIPQECSTVLTPSAGLIAGSLLLATLSILPFRAELRRQRAEKSHSAPLIPAASA
jgi:MFS family permease